MTATSVLSPNINGRPTLFHPWRLAIGIMAAINLAAFWFLLQYNYSPESYHTVPVGLGRAELAWIGISICIATVTVVLSCRNADVARRLVRAGLAATVVSMVVLVKTVAGARLRCLDAILFSTACGWAMVFWLRTGKMLDPDRTLSLRLGDRSWNPKIVNVLAAVVWIAAAGLFLYYMAQQIYYLNNLALGYADCGEMASLMYNTIHNPRELFLLANPGKPLFWNHFQPGVLSVVPLWLLWPDIKLTILLQILAVLGCAIPIYWIGKEVLQDKVSALLLVAVWLVFPSTSQFIYSGSYGFRCGNLCVPLYFLALACWMKGRRGWALIFTVWAILLKEEAAIPIGMFGLYLALFERRRLMGAAIATVAFAHFLLVTSVVIPSINHEGYILQHVFSALGSNKWEIFLSPWTKPGIFWGKLFEPSSFYFAALLLAPVLFVPLKRPSVLFVGSLVFLFDCLHPTLKNINYQYQAALLPVVFWALVAALRTDDRVRQRAILSGAIVSGILLSLFFGNTCWSKDTILPPLSPGRLRFVQQMGCHIDKSGSLFATQRVAAHFITQKYLYTNLPIPLSIDYVLLDLRDSWQEQADVRWLYELRNVQRQVEARPNLHLVDVEDGLLLYARQGTPLDARAVVEYGVLPAGTARQNLSLGYGIRVAAISILPKPGAGRTPTCPIRLTTFSTVDARTNVDISARCILQFGGKGTEIEHYASKFQPLGQGIWPIERWETGRFYADDFLISVPAELSNQSFTITFNTAALNP
jgi:uncharacterized membrane protein